MTAIENATIACPVLTSSEPQRIMLAHGEGGQAPGPRKLPGQTKYPNITLKWGLTDSRELYDWYLDVTKGIIERRSGSIILNDLQGAEVMRWNFKRGWPCKWTGPGLNAKNNEISMETVEICHEGLEIDGQG